MYIYSIEKIEKKRKRKEKEKKKKRKKREKREEKKREKKKKKKRERKNSSNFYLHFDSSSRESEVTLNFFLFGFNYKILSESFGKKKVSGKIDEFILKKGLKKSVFIIIPIHFSKF